MSPVIQTVLIVAACLVGAALLALLVLRRRRNGWLDPLKADDSGMPAGLSSPLAAATSAPEPAPAAAAISPVQDVPSSVPTDEPPARSEMLFGSLTPMLASALPENEENRRKTRQDLVAAGYYHPHAGQNLAAIRYLGIIVPLFAFGMVFAFGPPPLELFALIAALAGAGVGWALPKIYVQMRAGERRREIERAMPDMLDMLNMCVSQGMTLPSALSRVSREIKPVYPALSQELAIVTEQTKVGSLDQSLENFSRRIDVPEVHSFTSLLIQTERMGTSVSAALADHSDNIRESLRQRADKSANTAAFKLLFPTALFLMPAVFLFLLGPAIVDLTTFFDGDAGAAFRENRAAATRQLGEFSETP